MTTARATPAAAASVVVPVNARGDLDNVRRLLDDLARYAGPHRFETVLVVNNFDEGSPPAAIADYEAAGARVLAIPHVPLRPGVAIAFGARLPGVEAARSDWVIAFDADCRLPDPTSVIDWYVKCARDGFDVAYTHVKHYGLHPAMSVRAKIAAHHGSRWVKRVVLRIPTTRGSSYAIRRDLMLSLYTAGFLADDLNVGPAARARGARVAYSGHRSTHVLTSGRMYRPGWRRMLPYLWYRLRYNIRVLPVRADAAARTGRQHQSADRYDYTKPRR